MRDDDVWPYPYGEFREADVRTWAAGHGERAARWEPGEWVCLVAPAWDGGFAGELRDRLLDLERRWRNIGWRSRTTRRDLDRDTKVNLGGDHFCATDREFYRRRRGRRLELDIIGERATRIGDALKPRNVAWRPEMLRRKRRGGALLFHDSRPLPLPG